MFAVDLDEGENSRISYSLTGDPRCSIDSDGHISCNEGLISKETVSLVVHVSLRFYLGVYCFRISQSTQRKKFFLGY